MGHIKREHLRNALTVIPSQKIFSISENIFKPLRVKANLCLLENKILEEMRDIISSKLISGEISFSNIKNKIDEFKIQ